MTKTTEERKAMPLTLKLRKVGNSYMLTIPQMLMRLAELSEDAEFLVEVKDKEVVLTSIKSKKKSD